MQLRITEVMKSEARSILAVERLDALTARHVAGVAVSLSLRPVAIVVREGRHVVAYDMQAQPIDLDSWCDANPGLDVALTDAVAAQVS